MSAATTAATTATTAADDHGDCGTGLKGNTAAPSILRRLITSPCHHGSSSSPCGVLSTYLPPVPPKLQTFLREWLRPVSLAVASLVCLPLSFYTRESGTLPYEIKGGTFREIVIGWDALLHMSIWPLVVVISAAGFYLSHCLHRKGGCSAYCLVDRGAGGRTQKAVGGAGGGGASQSQKKGQGSSSTSSSSNQQKKIRTLVREVTKRWPLGHIGTYVVVLAAFFSISSVVHCHFQVVSPSWIWNPFMWGKYQVYFPGDIQTELEDLCIPAAGGGDGGSIGDGTTMPLTTLLDSSSSPDDDRTKPGDLRRVDRPKKRKQKQKPPPLCLKESSWRALSAEGLSSRNADDVEAVLRGVRYAQQPDHGLVINIMSRDTIDSIGPFRKNVEGLIPFFDKVAVVVFENDSKDGSRAAFKAWAEEVKDEYKVDVMECDDAKDCVFGESHRYDSTEAKDYFTSSAIGRMAEFRQRVVDYILGSDEYATNYSHMMVVDLDLKVSLSPLGVLHSLGRVPDAAVASSGRQAWPGSMGSFVLPYDFSAFRAQRSPRNSRILDLHQAFCELAPPGDRWRNACDAPSPFQLMLVLGHDWASGPEPYPVDSAFNGATIYPLNLIRESGAKYDAGPDGQRCEHIGFNLSLKKPMFVNPNWNMHLNPRTPGGPTGPRAVKNITKIAFTPKISLPIFFQTFGCMMLFVHSVLVLVMKVLYPGWSKIMRGTKVKYHVLPCAGGGKAGLKSGAGGKVVDMDYLIGVSPRKRNSSDFGAANNV